MERFAAVVEKSGRILIPVGVRRKLKLREGESQVVVNVDEGGITVSTRRQILERIRQDLYRQIPEGSDLAGELIADRRREARRESEK